jgi:photosystem II stability/assembly factor-like uncharacterized protein
MLLTTDSGSTWATKSRSATFSSINSLQFTTPDTGWAVDNSGALLSTVDGGATWFAVDTARESTTILQFVNQNTGWYVERTGLVHRTTDGGRTWDTSSIAGASPLFLKGWFATPSTGWVIGSAGTAAKTTDGGKSWFSLQTGTSAYCQDLYFLDSLRGWMSGAQSTLLRTTDGGTTWNPLTTGLSGTLYAVRFVNDLVGWVGGGNGALIKTTDGGVTWTPQQTGLTNGTYVSMQFLNGETGWLGPTVTTSGSLLRTTDGGATWTDEMIGAGVGISAMQFSDPENGWAAGTGGLIIRKRGSAVSTSTPRQPLRAGEFRLEQNYPNPFNPGCDIRYQLPASGTVHLAVYDLLGRNVATLVDGEQLPGTHAVRFDARGLASGVYLCRLTFGDRTTSIKLLHMK